MFNVYQNKNVLIIKRIIRDITPPVLWRTLRKLRSSFTGQGQKYIEWEYIPEGWQAEKTDPNIKGWDVESVLEAYKANWPSFVRNLEGTLPLGTSPELSSEQPTNFMFHNLMMTYGYVLAFSTRDKTSISMLDWGGGIGHYYLISQKLVPDLNIEYHCKDFPRFAEYGRKLFPHAYFYSDNTCLEREYDFVLASASLHYSQDWGSTLKDLAGATAGYLFVTRLPIVHRVPSYVMVQRPYQYGYNTEYLSWCLNRQEFLQCAETLGLKLIREFVVESLSPIPRAPEQPEHWGFLFGKESS